MVAIIIIVVDAITRIIMIDMLWYIIMDSRSNYKVWVDLPSSVFQCLFRHRWSNHLFHLCADYRPQNAGAFKRINLSSKHKLFITFILWCNGPLALFNKNYGLLGIPKVCYSSNLQISEWEGKETRRLRESKMNFPLEFARRWSLGVGGLEG